MRKLIFITILLPLLYCCDFSSSEEINDSEIHEIFDDIKIAFSMYDITEIMSHYNDSYLHNGNDYDDEYQIWDSRLNNYDAIDFIDIEITYIYDEYAEVTFTLELISGDNSQYWDEPSTDNGDISYFRDNNGTWEIYGNQLD